MTLDDLQSLHNLILKPGQTPSDILHILGSCWSALYIAVQKQLETHKKQMVYIDFSVMRPLILYYDIELTSCYPTPHKN